MRGIIDHIILFLSRLLIVLILCVSETISLFGQKNIRFALLADLHVNPGSVSDSNLHRIVDDINHLEVDFVIVAGDLSNTGSDAELNAVKSALDKLEKPCYVLPGNHETNWSESAGLTFNKLWGGDRFFFNYDGFTFIGYNTGPFMKMGDGLIKQEDLLWLKRQLSQRVPVDNILISVSHYPLAEGLNNWPEVTGILRSSACRLAFCGHGHRLSLYNFNGIPGIMGRAVIAGNSAVPGYNIVLLKNDSVSVYNKIPGIMEGKPSMKINYMKPDTLSMLPVSKFPDYSVNTGYSNLKVDELLSDTASIFTGPCLVNDTIIIYGNSAGSLKGIGTGSQKVIWQLKIPGPVYSTPVAAGQVIVLGTVDGTITGIDALKGRVLWSVNSGRPVLAEGAAEGSFIYIGGGDRSFYKVNVLNGKVVWKFDGVEGLMQGKPLLTASSVVFGAWDQHLYSLNKNTGALMWKWNNGKTQKLYSPGNIFPVSSENKIFIVAPDRYMTALDVNTGKEIWRTGRHQVRESMGISPDGSTVYAKLMNDTVIAVSSHENYPLTKWAINAGFGYEHNPCPVLSTDSLVIVATRDGMLVAIDPFRKTVVWKYKAGNSSVNKVVVDKSGKIWFTLMEGKIFSIDPVTN
jgi:outer membrane protein assembly factor BamB/predicted MPP superfamily phosphohydrolase